MPEPLDAAMFDGVEDLELPIRFRNKWMGRILLCLENGPRRFTELQVPLKGITPKVLAESLRALERDGMVTRTSYGGVPPRVEYELTELGRSLREPREIWCKWVDAHVHEILRARAAAAGPGDAG
ncbi:transcriptional regulator, HxlR family [Actinobacteria bacterium OK074]|nr:transcriptional regulator, HxlR family [Actinobacteria bacterium OK074]